MNSQLRFRLRSVAAKLNEISTSAYLVASSLEDIDNETMFDELAQISNDVASVNAKLSTIAKETREYIETHLEDGDRAYLL